MGRNKVAGLEKLFPLLGFRAGPVGDRGVVVIHMRAYGVRFLTGTVKEQLMGAESYIKRASKNEQSPETNI